MSRPERSPSAVRRRLRGGATGPILAALFAVAAVAFYRGVWVCPDEARAHGAELAYDDEMFGPKLAQPIAFSHRLHVTDKEIDCYYCHPYAERSPSAGLPSVAKCLGCHDHIIPRHEEIEKLRGYAERGEPLPWVRVYYNPDHVYFPHFRHLAAGRECAECHGEVERVDRLNQLTFYMGFCLDCHDENDASRECVACHQ